MESFLSALKRTIKFAISLAVYITSAVFRSIFPKKGNGIAIVLYYHEIPESQRARFGRQLDVLRRFSVPISLAELGSENNDGKPKVAVTFDDGFSSFGDFVVIEAGMRKIPVAVFVPTDHIGKKAEWMSAGDGTAGVPSIIRDSDIREISKRQGVTVGSHCMSHEKLTCLDDERASREMRFSKSVLERLTGKNVAFLSFPHGEHSVRHLAIAKACGYEQVFGILPSFAAGPATSFLCGRVRVDPKDTLPEFFLKIHGSYCWLPIAFRLKRRMKGKLNDAEPIH